MKRQSDKITALYCRLAHYDVGSELDALTGQNQQEALLKYAAEHGLENPKLFCDWGFSGTTFDRPEYQRMLREVMAGNVVNLVVNDFSRLGRNYPICGELLETILPMYGVSFHSVKDGYVSPEAPDESRQMLKPLLSLYRESRRGGRA